MTQGRSLKRAEIVTTVSEFTRTQAIEAFGLDASKVVVVPPVVRPMPTVSDDRCAELLAELRVHAPYILYPAATYPHKNHAMLLEAFATVAKTYDVTLVLTGAVGAGAWGSAHSTHADLADLVTRLGIDDRVQSLGYVTKEQLAALYAGAVDARFPFPIRGFRHSGARGNGCGMPRGRRQRDRSAVVGR